jgi:adenosine deaminase
MPTTDHHALFRALPKADLHRHLEGSITPETLLHVSRTFGGDLPTNDLDILRRLVHADRERPGFQAFLEKFNIYRGFYSGRDAIDYIARQAVREAAEDGVAYLELRYSPTHFSSKGRFPEREVVEWVHAALQSEAHECGIIVAPILTISRDYGSELARATLMMAISLPEGYFYGLDIAGDEMRHSALPFKELFALAKQAGLGVTIHAGEACGAHAVREAVCTLHADRIGHGIRALDDPEVVGLLKKKDVLLEVCLTSNVHTGSVASLEDHPVRELMRRGVPVCLNTDDPAISNSTLSEEYASAADRIDLSVSELQSLNRTALRHAFYPDREGLARLFEARGCQE